MLDGIGNGHLPQRLRLSTPEGPGMLSAESAAALAPGRFLAGVLGY